MPCPAYFANTLFDLEVWEQTVRTKIRLLLKKQSDLDPHYSLSKRDLKIPAATKADDFCCWLNPKPKKIETP